MKLHNAVIYTGGLALVAIALDQLVKWYLLSVLGLGAEGSRPIEVTGFFKLVMVWNYGISFGMLAHPGTYVPWFLKTVALVISIVVAWLAYRSHYKWEQVAYGLIIGGALGNVIDRIRFGAVADFFYFHIGEHYWPAFNIADASIFCGVALLILLSFKNPKPKKHVVTTENQP